MGPPFEVGQPAFRWENGTPLTSRKLNSILKDRLTGYLEGAEELYTTHSFRTGAASMMGTLGFSDEDIQSVPQAHFKYLRETFKDTAKLLDLCLIANLRRLHRSKNNHRKFIVIGQIIGSGKIDSFM